MFSAWRYIRSKQTSVIQRNLNQKHFIKKTERFSLNYKAFQELLFTVATVWEVTDVLRNCSFFLTQNGSFELVVKNGIDLQMFCLSGKTLVPDEPSQRKQIKPTKFAPV